MRGNPGLTTYIRNMVRLYSLLSLVMNESYQSLINYQRGVVSC